MECSACAAPPGIEVYLRSRERWEFPALRGSADGALHALRGSTGLRPLRRSAATRSSRAPNVLRHLTKEGQAPRWHLFGRHYCAGWDLVYAPNPARREADVVNLGYVVNVIEDPSERREVLRRAWSLARQILVVSARFRLKRKGATTAPRDARLLPPYPVAQRRRPAPPIRSKRSILRRAGRAGGRHPRSRDKDADHVSLKNQSEKTT